MLPLNLLIIDTIMGRLSMLMTPVSVFLHRQTALTKLEKLPDEVLLSIFKQVELFTELASSDPVPRFCTKCVVLGLLDFDLDNLSTSEQTTVLQSLPFEIVPPTIPNGSDRASVSVKCRLICSCCDWEKTYRYGNPLSFCRHLSEEADKAGHFLTRFMQPVIMHAIVLKVMEYERRLSYAGFLTLKLPRQSTRSEAASEAQAVQDGGDSEQSANGVSQVLGLEDAGLDDFDSDFGNFIASTRDRELVFGVLDMDHDDEIETKMENELENELSDLYDRRWDLRKNWDESESESGGESGDEEQEKAESTDGHYQED